MTICLMELEMEEDMEKCFLNVMRSMLLNFSENSVNNIDIALLCGLKCCLIKNMSYMMRIAELGILR